MLMVSLNTDVTEKVNIVSKLTDRTPEEVVNDTLWIQFQKVEDIPDEIDYDKMLAPPKEKKEITIDDASGDYKIWKIEGFNKILIDPSEHGVFFDGESYIMLYHYKKWDKDMWIIYFWQGRTCPILKKGTSAALSINPYSTIIGSVLPVFLCMK